MVTNRQVRRSAIAKGRRKEVLLSRPSRWAKPKVYIEAPVSARTRGVGAELHPSGIRTGRPTKRALARRAVA